MGCGSRLASLCQHMHRLVRERARLTALGPAQLKSLATAARRQVRAKREHRATPAMRLIPFRREVAWVPHGGPRRQSRPESPRACRTLRDYMRARSLSAAGGVPSWASAASPPQTGSPATRRGRCSWSLPNICWKSWVRRGRAGADDDCGV